MIKFNDFYTLVNEGGAAGHMPHPFDLEGVNRGRDLIRIFEDSASHIAMKSAATKVDGTNNSIRLVNGPNGKEFALDRGSMKEIDLEGITISRLEEKWPAKVKIGPNGEVQNEPHGMIKSGQLILGIMNEALPFIEAELKALKMWDVVPATESRFINTEFVESGGTNVVDYGKNFIAFHGINKFKHLTGKNPKTGINRRESSEVADRQGNLKYNVNAFERLVDKVHAISKKKDFDTHGTIPVRFIGQPNFVEALQENISIIRMPGETDTKTLDIWLSTAKNPGKEKVKLADGGKMGAMEKKVYQYVIGENETSHNETIPVGEGVVIRGLKSGGIIHPPFKITGEFIVTGLLSGF